MDFSDLNFKSRLIAQSDQASDSESDVAVEVARPKLGDPPKYAVLLHNDDYTTMEFVVEILQTYFQKTQADAVQVMLAVHQQGTGVAGIYPLEIAETKVVQVEETAQAKGFPLKCSIEKV